LAQTLVFVTVIGIFLATGQASIYHPLTVYLGFHGLVFVVRPLLVHYLNFDTVWRYMLIQPSDELLIKTLTISSVAMLVFAATCLGLGWTHARFTQAPAPFSDAQRRALVVTTAILLPVVLYSVHSFTSGGLDGKFVGGTYIMTGASGYTIEAQFMAGPLICGWLAVSRFNRWALIPILPYIAYRSYAGLSRWTIVLLFLSMALIYAWQKRIRWLPMWAVTLVIPLYLLFHALGQNRAAFHQLITGDAPAAQQNDDSIPASERMKSKYDSQEFANFDFLCYVIRAVPEKTGTFTYGSQYLQLFTEPIPRKLWPGKPAGAPIGFFNLNNYGDFLGLTPSLVGDGWMSGGWLGLIITMSIVGSLLGLAHRIFWRHIQNNMVALFYLVGIAMLPQWYRDGGISISKFLFWNLSPMVLWLILSWVCGPRLMPGYHRVLPRGVQVKFPAGKQIGRGATAANVPEPKGTAPA
jgi:hypothetical protein